jgi:hypothetical protein
MTFPPAAVRQLHLALEFARELARDAVAIR